MRNKAKEETRLQNGKGNRQNNVTKQTRKPNRKVNRTDKVI